MNNNPITALGDENRKLREAIRKFLSASGHDLCHENRRELASAIGMDDTWPCVPPEPEFALGCVRYREQLFGPPGPCGPDAGPLEIARSYLSNRLIELEKQLEKHPLTDSEGRQALRDEQWLVARLCDQLIIFMGGL